MSDTQEHTEVRSISGPSAANKDSDDSGRTTVYNVSVHSSTNQVPLLGGPHFRVMWLDSVERKQFVKVRNITVSIAAVLIIAGIVAYFLLLGRLVIPYLPLLFSLLILIFTGSVLQGTYLTKRRAFTDRYVLGQANELEEEEKEVAAKASGGQLDLPSLWAANQTRINYYHDIATSQAEQSFRVGMWAAVAGFVAVIALGVVAAYAPNGTAAIAASVVGVAGAAMSAYVGATFMKTQAQASKQLSRFFLQPVEFARLLGAERLLETLEPSQRADVVSNIVNSMMASPSKEEAEKEEPNP